MENVQLVNIGEFGKLEVYEKDGKIYFPATECAEKLRYKEPEKAVRSHCRWVSKIDTHLDSLGRTQQKNYIPKATSTA